ncbi:hypothetical protein VTL71DRAFT_3106 [Oculimacula yallundae]|uniref:Tim44-like domain-containing protein n=1 Tax=Oculimacula yallundae TaxID=86028 RepID=A0ABR4C7D4_9HELO
MSHSISFRRPLPLFRALRSSCSQPQSRVQRQCFSQSSLLQDNRIMGQRPRQAAEPSRRVMMKQASEMPSDVGMLDFTFVTPTGANIPSLLRTPKAYLKLRWEHIKTRFRDRFSLFVLWVSAPSVNKKFFTRSIALSRRTITPTAVALHRQMYTLFAEGQLSPLRRMCTDGIYETFAARVEARQKGEKVVWELVRYNGRAKLISHRGAKIPMEGAAIRQAVVRIASTQKLTRWVRGKMVEGTGKEKDVVEYLVLQKMVEDWQEGGWRVWGTTKETTVKELRDWDKKKTVD